MTAAPALRRAAAVALAAFAASLAVLAAVVGRGGGAAEVARPALPDAPRPGLPTAQRIATLQATVRAAPRRADGWTLLAAAELQRARETGDAGSYVRADGAVRRALALAPQDAGALTQASALALARHDFRGGLRLARRARAAAPSANAPFGVLVDALVELGRYRAAGRALQAMVDRRPGLAAYARVSYWRELHGDLGGAVGAMRLAVSAGGDGPENEAYVQALLGGLELQRGRVGAARRAYRDALASVPGYVPARAGLAQVDVARGRAAAAVARLRGVVDRLPLPAHVVALAEAERAAGRPAAARRDLGLVEVERRLLVRAGVDTDVELALVEADHGRPLRAVALARRAWAAAPSVRSADALGWALTRARRPRAGVRWARRALALGSRDPSLLLHAGIAARAAGDRVASARWLAGAYAGRAALGARAREMLR